MPVAHAASDNLTSWATIKPSMNFRVRIEQDPVDGGYVAECLDLPGCMSQGETEEEALANLADAIGGVIAARMEAHLRKREYEELQTGDARGSSRAVTISV